MNNQMSRTLYIGNLSVITTTDMLTRFLKTIADVVDVEIVLNDNSRSRRCYAIAEMLNTKEVDMAVKKLNGTVFQGRVIQVRRQFVIGSK